MKLTNLSKFTQSVQQSASKHAPEILVGIGIAGWVTTAVLVGKATPKALELIEAKKQETGEDKLSVVDTVKTTWKCYAPAALTGTMATVCLIGSSNVSLKRNAALATAYKLTETAFTEYKDKVVETIGEKKEKVIKDKIAKEQIEKNPVSKNEIIITDKGNTLCYEALSGRYFKCDIDRIHKAENEINRKLNLFWYVSLNEFYSEIGLKGTELGEQLGWNADRGLVQLELSSHVTDNGEPALVINYNIMPVYDFDNVC